MHQGQDEADEGSANPYVGRSGTSDRGKRDSVEGRMDWRLDKV